MKQQDNQVKDLLSSTLALEEDLLDPDPVV